MLMVMGSCRPCRTCLDGMIRRLGERTQCSFTPLKRLGLFTVSRWSLLPWPSGCGGFFYMFSATRGATKRRRRALAWSGPAVTIKTSIW